MRRRKLLVVLVALAVVVAVGTVVLWPESPSRIKRDNFDRVEDGMSRAEVEAILGPPGDYRIGPTRITGVVQVDVAVFAEGEGVGTSDAWKGDRVDVLVTYDQAGAVRDKECYAASQLAEGPLDKLLWRAKRQWHRWFP